MRDGGVAYEILRDVCFYVRIRNKHWTGVVEKNEKRCACWQVKLLSSIARRITLVQVCLTNMPLFMTSCYPIPVGILKKANFVRARMVWQAERTRKVPFS